VSKLVVVSVCVAAAMVGCHGKEKEHGQAAPGSAGATGTSAPASATAKAEADDIFATRCTPCHGPAGEGNGPASATLSPRPRNFHDPSWQSGISDAEIEKVIAYGGAAVGKSAAMPANPDLAGKPEVISALREKVRGFKR
jgi:hypothetical protein